MNKTALYEQHLKCGAKIVDFHHWMMPLHYGSQLDEHHAVRKNVGMFDVSHMSTIDITGKQARDFLRYLLSHDVNKLVSSGSVLYSGMLNEQGGVIDDLLAYYFAEDHFRLVANSANKEKDLQWINRHASRFDVTVRYRDDLSIIAVQGPNSQQAVLSLLSSSHQQLISQLPPFSSLSIDDVIISTTGYTGEHGYELTLPAKKAVPIWEQLLAKKVIPCGLGARDTLRLEAGMNLYGFEMDETISPLIANMAFTVTWEPKERDFLGRQALEQQRAMVNEKLVGLVMNDRGILRAGSAVIFISSTGEQQQGVVTSGTFSPTLGCGIALARVAKSIGNAAKVVIRQKEHEVKVIKPCFVRNGQPAY